MYLCYVQSSKFLLIKKVKVKTVALFSFPFFVDQSFQCSSGSVAPKFSNKEQQRFVFSFFQIIILSQLNQNADKIGNVHIMMKLSGGLF